MPDHVDRLIRCQLLGQFLPPVNPLSKMKFELLELRMTRSFISRTGFRARIVESGHSISGEGRNRYPDFEIEAHDEAFEVKGITVGSRENDFDSNSALPSGEYKGKRVFYVFGRYESVLHGGDAPNVLDVVIADGTFLNAGPGFLADNKSLRVLGSYGDILFRDRKMYAPHTPYKLLSGLRGHCTLIMPASEKAAGGRLRRSWTILAHRGRSGPDRLPW